MGKVDNTPIGKTYNHLTVVSSFFDRKETKRGEKVKWFVCKCVCGKEKSIRSGDVLKKNGGIKSCGCKRFLELEAGRKKYQLKTFKYSAERRYYSRYKNDAKRNNKIFDLIFDKFLEMIKQNCVYCGAAPSLKVFSWLNRKKVLANGMDRVDSSMGYIEANVVPCCRICNMMKNTLTVRKFINHIRKINKHNS